MNFLMECWEFLTSLQPESSALAGDFLHFPDWLFLTDMGEQLWARYIKYYVRPERAAWQCKSRRASFSQLKNMKVSHLKVNLTCTLTWSCSNWLSIDVDSKLFSPERNSYSSVLRSWNPHTTFTTESEICAANVSFRHHIICFDGI